MKSHPLTALLVIITVVSLTFLPSCHKKDQICPISVSGTMTDSLTGQPVSGIEVILWSNRPQTPALKQTDIIGRDTTDVDGHYSMKNTTDCSNSPVVTHYGSDKYEPLPNERRVETERENEVDFKLKPRDP